MRLVNLLMRDEGPDTAIEEIGEDEDMAEAGFVTSSTPSAATTLVSADGKPVRGAVEHATNLATVPPPQPEEDEEEMLIEI